jgi:chorismate synthase
LPGNTFGQLFRITTFGESHGAALGVVIDGCPPELSLCEDDFMIPMAARRPAGHPLSTPRKEPDRVEILSGVFEGRTTGAPITLLIRNRDVNSAPYEVLRETFRPGHADYTYRWKYGHHDFRGGGRASARETAARVAAAVVAEKILDLRGITTFAYTLELGGIGIKRFDNGFMNSNPLFCPDPDALEPMMDALARARDQGDSLGGIVEIRVEGCPAGLGEPVFDKLEADLAKAVMSVGSVKGFEVGEGFASARLKGSKNNDPIGPKGFLTNRAGGILGGISNGEEIVLRAAVKPIPSIKIPQQTVDLSGNPVELVLSGRFDPCAIPRVVPVLKAMVALVVTDHLVRSHTMETCKNNGRGLK